MKYTVLASFTHVNAKRELTKFYQGNTLRGGKDILQDGIVELFVAKGVLKLVDSPKVEKDTAKKEDITAEPAPERDEAKKEDITAEPAPEKDTSESLKDKIANAIKK